MSPSQDRLLDLLCDRVTEGLDPAAAHELDALLATDRGESLEEWELAAATLHVGLMESASEPIEPLPEHLRQRLVASAPLPRGGAPTVSADPTRARRSLLLAASGWAAAAAVLLIWWFAPPRASAPPGEGPKAAPDWKAVHAQLEKAPAKVQWDWQPGPHQGSEVRGDVVWDPESQRGVMRISGLPANDPARESYQLWIKDARRDGEKSPLVDGGVFDVPAGDGEVYLPIDAKLDVRQPALFAVTVERPGGVVVSKQERVVLVAQP